MPTWETAADWDAATAQDGTVHQSVANTDHTDDTQVKQGYDYVRFDEIGPDPVNCWPHHEDSGTTSTDVAGSNDGTVNGPAQGQTGLLGTTAYSFDGVDDRIDVGKPIDPADGTGFSVSGWVNFDDLNNRQILSAQDNSGAGEGGLYLLRHDSTQFEFYVYDSTTLYEAAISDSNYSAGEWLHWVAVADGGAGEHRLYLNGGQASDVNTSWGGTYEDFTATAYHGYYENGNNYLDGDLADVRFYDVALSQSQAQALYDVVADTGTLTTAFKSY
jgi:hypothetical protein